MSNTYTTKPGALDGLELGAPIGGGGSSSFPTSSTSSSGPTGGAVNTDAGVLAGMGAGHHDQTSNVSHNTGTTPIADKFMGASSTPTGAIGGGESQPGNGIKSYNAQGLPIATPGNLSSATHGGDLPGSGSSGKGAGMGLAAGGLAGAGAGAAYGASGKGDAYQEGREIAAKYDQGHGGVLTSGGAGATGATGAETTGAPPVAAAGAGGLASELKKELKEHQDDKSLASEASSHPESKGPHGLVWHNGKYVHQRELNLEGSTGVPLKKELFEKTSSRGGSERGSGEYRRSGEYTRK